MIYIGLAVKAINFDSHGCTLHTDPFESDVFPRPYTDGRTILPTMGGAAMIYGHKQGNPSMIPRLR